MIRFNQCVILELMERINLNKLYYFHVVAKTGSVKAATKKLNLTQSTISGQIRQLEEELGFNLFIRKHRKLELSARGERVLKKSDKIFSMAESLRDVSSSSDDVTRINIGVIPSLANLFVYDFSLKLWKDRKIRIATYPGTMPQLIQMMDQNKVDMILSDGFSAAGKRYRNLRLGTDPVVAVCRNKKPFSGTRFPQSLAGQDYVKIAQPSNLQSDIDYHLKLLNIEPRVVGEAHDSGMVKAILSATDGFSILPKKSVRNELKKGNLKLLGQMEAPSLLLTATLPAVSEHQKVIRNLIRDHFQRKNKS